MVTGKSKIEKEVKSELPKDATVELNKDDRDFKDNNQIMERIEQICKGIATIIIVISAGFHMYRLFRYEKGGQTCPLLFESGHWIGDKWQPDGCMIHEYEAVEVKSCLQNQEVALIGDSRIRSLYFHLANTLSDEPVQTGKSHENLSYHDKKNNLTINFFWISQLDDNFHSILKRWLETGKIPKLILVGVGTWTIKNAKHTAIVDYQEKLISFSPTMNNIGKNLTLEKLKMMSESKSRFHHEPQIIWMMQDPVVEEKLSKPRKTITNLKIELYNYASQKSLAMAPFVHTMSATTLMAAGKPEHAVDGLHYDSFIIKNKLDAILNAFCNDYVYPDDATCCRNLDRVTQLQFNMFAIFFTCVILWGIMFVCCKRREKIIRGFTEAEIKAYDNSSMFPWLYSKYMYSGMKAMAKLGFIIFYIFLADSSLLYDKGHKTYSHAAFFVPLAAIFLIAMLTRGTTKQTEVLNSNQVEEWKGWMITVIMLYNYTQAEQVLPIFVNVRLLIFAFLFLVGFVHFTKFWYSGDFRFYRICQVLAHLNVFCVLLCLSMGHSYQFYFLTPLITFWFFVVYITMAFFPRVTDSIVAENQKKVFFIVGKLIILFIFVFVVWAHENICEWLFSLPLLKEFFVDVNGSVAKWRFHSGLHRYAVLFGMVTAFIYVNLKRHEIIKDTDNYGNILPNNKYTIAAILVALCAIIGYEVQAFTCHSKSLCDHTHSLAACIPVIGFVVLRNLPGILRTKYSKLFAWIGNMSLELFIGQYHIWLSNDGFGVHVLIPGFPTINAIVTSFTFVCVIHEVTKICTILANLLVTKDVRVMLRRLLIFILLLLVVWWHKTHEKRPVVY